MNLAQSGYHLLMILSIVDGKYQQIEGEVILDFLTKNYDEKFNLDAENRKLTSLKKEKIADHFSKSAKEFHLHSTTPQRLDLLTFMIDLATADGSITKEERKIITSLAKSWSIDIEPIFSKKLGSGNA
ncbi:MAG: TerB family tellurite resistance protein [Bacteroidia bacterium]